MFCLVRGGKEIVCLGGISKTYTAAKVIDDGDGSFVIDDAINTACRCPTHQKKKKNTQRQQLITFHPSQLNSCLFVNLFLACQNLDYFLGMGKRQQVLV